MKKNLILPLAVALVCAKTAIAADEVHWTVTGQNSVTVNWHGTANENVLSYRLGSGAKVRAVAKHPTPMPYAAKGTFWEATLTGLKENSQYAYAIGNGPERNFKTPPPRGAANFTVYAQGTIGDTGKYFNAGVIQDLIAAGKPSFVIGLGDLSLGSVNGQASVNQHFNDVMAWSREAAYMPVWGDMDARNNAKDNFKNYKGRFVVPNSQASPGSPVAGGEDWYWFDYGNTRFITLPEPWAGAWADWKTKANKLMAEAQAAPNVKFIVTFAHRPAYSSGHFVGSPVLKGMLDAFGDKYSKYVLNVNSHSADYERSHPQHGVVHVTAGIGGQNLMQDGKCLWLTCAKPTWSAYRAMHQGALKLHFSDTAIAGSFICGPAGGGVNDVKCAKGSVVDKFTIAAKSVVPTAAKPVSAVAASAAVPPTMAATVSTATCNKVALSVSGLINDGGYSYRLNRSFGTAADNKNSWSASKLRLFENGVEIGPAHTGHPAIRSSGGGRFSHWVDNAGKESLRFSASNNSNPATNGKAYTYCIAGTTAAVGDSQAPSVPASVKAVAASSSQINVSWAKSSDNTAVTGYRIYRNGVQLANTTYLSFPSTGLAAGTSYSYTVAAYDAAGNLSATSTTVSAKTTSTAAPAPTPAPAPTASCARAPASSVVVNVRDKGATPNDSSNDTPAIQSAIDQAAATGGTAYVPDGTYMIDTFKRVMMKSGVTLKLSSGAILKAIGSNRPIYDVIRVEYASNVNIIGGTVQGDRYSHSGTGGEHGHGIEVWGGKNVVIEGVTAKEAWGDGVYVGSGSANVTLCSVIADNNRRQGLTLTDVDGVLVKNSVFKGSNGTIPYAGIDIEPNVSEFVRNVKILNSQMINNKGPGLQFGFSSPQAAATSGVTNVTVDGNTIANNGVPGSNYYASGVVIHAQKAGGIAFTNNIVKNSAQDGIAIVGGTKNTRITGNTITGSGINNNVDRYIGNGIMIYDSGTTGNVVINNTIYDNKVNIYDGVGGNTISPNTLR